MKSLRIALYTDADRFAGTERNILDLARGLQRLGHASCILCPSNSVLAERAAAEQVAVTPIPKGGMLDRAAVRALSEAFRSGELEVVHVHNGRCALIATMAIRAAKMGRCVMSQQFIEPAHTTRQGLSHTVSRFAHRWVNEHIDHFIAISQAVQQSMLERSDAPANKITLIPHGIPSPDASQLKAREAVRQELGVPAESPMIVCASRLTTEKDVGTLVRAMDLVRQACPSAIAVLAGDGPLRASVEEQIRALNLGSSVRLLGFRSDVLSIIQAGDIFTLPSLAEPFGIVVIEAMALERPVVATGIGGPLEIVVDGETGLLTPPCVPERFAEAILTLVQNPGRARTMGLAGRRRYEAAFTADRMVRDTLKVYQHALCS